MSDKITIKVALDKQQYNQDLEKTKRDIKNFSKNATKDGKITLAVKIATLQSGLAKARAEVTKFRKAWNKDAEIIARMRVTQFQKDISIAKRSLTSVKKSFLSVWSIAKDFLKWFWALFLVNQLAGLVKSIWRAGLEFESSFAGIRKTIEATNEEFEILSKWMRRLAKEIPINVNELNKIGEIGGQLWVAKEDLIDFTRTIALIWASTDLTTEGAATQFAKFANAMWEPLSKIWLMASAVVQLWNNFAVQEPQLLDFAQRLAGAGKIAGFTADEIFALSATLASVWISSEAGATAMSKALVEMTTNINKWWKDLKAYWILSGLTAKEFKRSWEEDAGWTFAKVIEWIKSSWKDGVLIIEDLFWKNTRTTRSFLGLAEGVDIFSDALEQSENAIKNTNALTEEANKRFETGASRLQLLGNHWNDLKIIISNTTTQALIPSTKAIKDNSDQWQGLVLSIIYWVKWLAWIVNVLFTQASRITSLIWGVFMDFYNNLDVMKNRIIAVVKGIGKWLKFDFSGALDEFKKLDSEELKVKFNVTAAVNKQTWKELDDALDAHLQDAKNFQWAVAIAFGVPTKNSKELLEITKKNVQAKKDELQAQEDLNKKIQELNDNGGKWTQANIDKQKDLEKTMDDYVVALDKSASAIDKFWEKSKKVYQWIKNTIIGLKNEIDSLTEKYDEQKKANTKDFSWDLAERQIDLKEDEDTATTKLQDLTTEWLTADAERLIDIKKEQKELEQEILDIQKEQKMLSDIIATEWLTEQVEKVVDYEQLTATEKLIQSYKDKQAAETEAYELEKKHKEELIRLNEFLSWTSEWLDNDERLKNKIWLIRLEKEGKIKNNEEFREYLEEAGFEDLSNKELLDAQKTAMTVAQLDIEKNEILSQQQKLLEIKTEYIDKFEGLYKASVDNQIAETDRLIARVEKAIVAQRKLNSLRGSSGSSGSSSSSTTYNNNINVKTANNTDTEFAVKEITNKITWN